MWGRIRRPLTITVIVVLGLGTALGAGAWWGERRAGRRDVAPSPPAAQDSAAAPAPSDQAVEVTLTSEAIERAGIKIAVAQAGSAVTATTVPGTVMSNAYRDTKVNALVGGVVRRVGVELGAAVRRGDPLAVVFSSELAEAQMKYLSARAMFEADHQKRERTEKLLEVGAASRQELEEIRAIHTARETELAAARQRLLLLGLSAGQVERLTDPSHVVSEVTVPAPAGGVVVARSINPGQVVSAGQELFVVTDLGTVWVIGDLYEKDFPLVRVGAPATVSVPSAPDHTLQGRVAYIDPRVDPATRTAKVRVEVPNRGGDLRLGMFVTVTFQAGSGERRAVVPGAAVQTIGDRSVVYVPAEGEDGKFIERPVKLGAPAGDFVQVLDGVKPGEKIVTDGSFFLRAEAARSRSGS